MRNKLIFSLIILLVIYSAGIGYYAFSLNSKLDDLEGKVASFEITQTDRIDALNAYFDDLKNQTINQLSAIDEHIGEMATHFNSLQEETINTIDEVNERINSISDDITSIDARITAAEEQLDAVSIDAAEIYESVVQSVVRISNGDVTFGSGVIMDTEGHVMTARHVIEALSDIYVVLYDGRVSRATLVGESALSDIAILEMDINPGIDPPSFGDSSQLNVGDIILAIGSPVESESNEELRDTLTMGTVSQLNRFVQIDGSSIPNLIQFDAPVNPGNSGCPLFNADAEIVGIVIARISPTEGDGISFAVSANKAQRAAAAILENGIFDIPWLGVAVDDLTSFDVEDLELDSIHGVFVLGVFTDSPAEAAGITASDIIVSVNDSDIWNMADLTSYLAGNHSPGDLITITVIRDGELVEIQVELDSRPE